MIIVDSGKSRLMYGPLVLLMISMSYGMGAQDDHSTRGTIVQQALQKVEHVESHLSVVPCLDESPLSTPSDEVMRLFRHSSPYEIAVNADVETWNIPTTASIEARYMYLGYDKQLSASIKITDSQFNFVRIFPETQLGIRDVVKPRQCVRAESIIGALISAGIDADDAATCVEIAFQGIDAGTGESFLRSFLQFDQVALQGSDQDIQSLANAAVMYALRTCGTGYAPMQSARVFDRDLDRVYAIPIQRYRNGKSSEITRWKVVGLSKEAEWYWEGQFDYTGSSNSSAEMVNVLRALIGGTMSRSEHDANEGHAQSDKN